MISAVIIDDEMKSAELLHLKLARFCPQVEVLSIFTNAAAGILFVAEKKPTVVFMDIEMPDISGLIAAKQLNSITDIIFVTAYEKYSIEALRLTAVDYLLKPIDEVDLKNAIVRLEEKQRLKNKADNKNNINQQFDKIAVPTIDGIHFLSIKDILKVEAESNYAIFFLQDKKKITVSKTLKQVEEVLEPYTFFRPHKSYIINIQFVSRYIRGEGGTIVMADGSEVELSRTKKKEFLELFEGL